MSQKSNKKGNIQTKGNEPLPYVVSLRLRIILCVTAFVAFAAAQWCLPGRMDKTIYRKLEEPMSVEKIETWAHIIQAHSQKFYYHQENAQ